MQTFQKIDPLVMTSVHSTTKWDGPDCNQYSWFTYFQYKTTQSILFTTPNSVYCLSNIATATATEVSLLKKRFNFFLFH